MKQNRRQGLVAAAPIIAAGLLAAVSFSLSFSLRSLRNTAQKNCVGLACVTRDLHAVARYSWWLPAGSSCPRGPFWLENRTSGTPTTSCSRRQPTKCRTPKDCPAHFPSRSRLTAALCTCCTSCAPYSHASELFARVLAPMLHLSSTACAQRRSNCAGWTRYVLLLATLRDDHFTVGIDRWCMTSCLCTLCCAYVHAIVRRAVNIIAPTT